MSDKHGGCFEFFMIGAIIGGVLGMLFAPASGEETRKKIKCIHDENEESIETAKAKTEQLINKTREAIEDGFQKLTDMLEEKKKRA